MLNNTKSTDEMFHTNRTLSARVKLWAVYNRRYYDTARRFANHAIVLYYVQHDVHFDGFVILTLV